ncbi:MAG: bifunctional UDP-N-acetylglucosamine diphosphorylase/glucosamine-1-phosphate N-acetyltransferase GlmU [Pseudomonadales bacterium]|jgi:bifunctional UDP-N-acetylglucosamine pyrophosphorylase/glucosamine-1-phosphate N-acetyltransferase
MTNPPAGQDKLLDKPLEIVVLAAGQGKRMRSALPKVLHPLAGRSMLSHVLTTARALEPTRIHVVVGHQGNLVRESIEADPALAGVPLNWVEQAEQRGTAHAVSQALPDIDDGSVVLVTYGDVPLVREPTLCRCASAAAEGALALVTAEFADPAELGRIVRDASGAIRAIVEFADADQAQRGIREINSGILALGGAQLRELLGRIQPHNRQGEYYLTDLVSLAVDRNVPVVGLLCREPFDVTGINDRIQLAAVEREFQRRLAEELMSAGVTIADPARIDVRGTVEAGPDCFLDVNVVLKGRVRLGRGVTIGPGCVVVDSELGDGVFLDAHTVVEGLHAGAGCVLGPFARIRPGTELAEQVKIGNFVEAKKAKLGRGTKASHLTYLGDATLGEHCNVGAGTVTCNYDGINKHQTTIGDGVFVGTNSTLVAPLEIAAGSYVAAGSTITSRVDRDELAIGRARQRNISGWTRPDQRPSKGESEDD